MTDPRFDTTLRYVDAAQLDNRVLDLDGLDVRDRAGDHLGEVDGVLVDTATGRARYLVVDSGGWFRSKRFVLPVGHARLDASSRSLRVDADREAINRFPAFDNDAYDRLSRDEWTRYDEGVDRAMTGDDDTVVRSYRAEYAAEPAWWHASVYLDRDRIDRPADRDRTREIEREQERMRAADETRAPAYGERAQPGDVIGIESGGERTGIGDTAADEDRRRQRAEKGVRDLDFDENHDRKRE